MKNDIFLTEFKPKVVFRKVLTMLDPRRRRRPAEHETGFDKAVPERPTVKSLSQFVEGLKHRPTAQSGTASNPTTHQGAGDGFLSIQERNSLMRELLRPETAPHIVCSAYRIRGALEIAKLEACVNQLVQRHAILRTSYTPIVRLGPIMIRGWKDCQAALQMSESVRTDCISFTPRTHRESKISIRVIQRMPLSEDVLPTIVEYARELIDVQFDYTTPPLLRVWIVNIDLEDCVLLILMPHVVTDGWSMRVFRKELFALYASGDMAISSILPELTLQYREFAEHQMERLTDVTRSDRGIRMIRERSECRALSIDQLRGQYRRIGGQLEKRVALVRMEDMAYEHLRARAHGLGTTVGMFVFACFGISLWIASGLDSFALWVLQANRSRAEFENIIGFIASGQLLCVRCSAEVTIHEVIHASRRELSDATVLEAGIVRGMSSPHRQMWEIGYQYFSRDNVTEIDTIPGLAISQLRIREPDNEGLGMRLVVVDDAAEQRIEMKMPFHEQTVRAAEASAVLRGFQYVLLRAVDSVATQLADLC